MNDTLSMMDVLLMWGSDQDDIKVVGAKPDIRTLPWYARKHGSLDVWPGCGREGRCKPCGAIKQDAKGYWVCHQWEAYGCPSETIQARNAEHDWGKVGCKECGKRRGWLDTSTGTWHETRRKAYLAGADLDHLVRAGGEYRGKGEA